MTSEKIQHLMNSAIYQLKAFDPCLHLNDERSIFEFVTTDNAYFVIFDIGSKELSDYPQKDWPVEQAMVPIVGLFHEVCGHGGQLKHEFNKDTELSKVLALNHYACNASDNYYGIVDGNVTRQYYSQPKEIAAQYMGIKCAYRFLSQEYSEAEANDMLCKYVNYRMKNDSECIATGKYYTSVDDVLFDFDKEFKKQVYAHRKYGLDNNYDMLAVYSNSRDLGSKLKIRVVSCQNGMKQDWMMTSIYLDEYDKNDRIKTKSALKNINMPVSEAFGYTIPPVKPKPKPKDMRLDLTASLLIFPTVLRIPIICLHMIRFLKQALFFLRLWRAREVCMQNRILKVCLSFLKTVGCMI